ncbi:MAG: riboflavin biosynthesis protein RibF [Opitutaceae bacterium]|nr:riboflavin biosynthesis protein RibF [Opitutaceae bacterium]
MKAPVQFDALERVNLLSRPLHLAIGMFDGVHLGHQSVIESAIHSARRSGGLAGVLTFWPHPSSLISPDHPTRLIMSPEMKRTILARLGIDFLIEQHFTPEFARIGAWEFVPLLKRCLPQIAAVYVGENWRFGRGREGDVALLVEAGRKDGIAVFSAPRINHNGAPISSTRLRALLVTGEIEQVNDLLGYSYFAEGVVETGRRLGHHLGFPTLNIPWEPELPPRYGVYLVRVQAGRSPRRQSGVANYGVRPTVGTDLRPLLEVHMLEETSMGPGDKVTVHWLRFLRPERKFGSQEELRTQIARDREQALALLPKTSAS